MSKQTIKERLFEACKINNRKFVEIAIKQIDIFVHKIYYDCLLASITNNNFDIATIIINLVPNRGFSDSCELCMWNIESNNIRYNYTRCICAMHLRQDDNQKIFKLICDKTNMDTYNFFINKISLKKITPTSAYINIFFDSKMINMPQAGILFMDLFTEITKQITIKKEDFITIYEYYLINYKDAYFDIINLLEKYAKNQYQNTFDDRIDILRPICENGNYEGFINICVSCYSKTVFEYSRTRREPVYSKTVLPFLNSDAHICVSRYLNSDTHKYDIKNLFIYACKGGNINIIKYLLNYEPIPNILDGIIMLCHSCKNPIPALSYLTSISTYNYGSYNYKQSYVENEFGKKFFEREPYISLTHNNKILMSDFFKINYYFGIALINDNIGAMKFLIKLYRMKQFYYTPVDIYNIYPYRYNSSGSSYLIHLGLLEKNKTYKTKNILL